MYSYSRASPTAPGLTCAEAHIFCFEDLNSSPRNVHWLDCSTFPPKPLSVTHTQLNQIVGMTCCITDFSKRLLVVYSKEIVQMYDGESDTLLWELKDRFPGMVNYTHTTSLATDAYVLFLCDGGNACIHAVRLSSGDYICCLIREGEQGMGFPRSITYERFRKCLHIHHEKGGVQYLTEATVQRIEK